MHSLIVEPEAEADLAQAFTWYSARRSGLGDEFLTATEACFASILRHPDAFLIVHAPARRALMRRFPYAVYFVREREAIHVVAVLHTGRDPAMWKKRAKSK